MRRSLLCEEDKSRFDRLRDYRRSIDWRCEEDRLHYVREAVRVILQWSSQQVLDFRKVLRSEEIKLLVSDCVNHRIINYDLTFDEGPYFIYYLAKRGDRAYLSPRIDPQGRPVLLCSTLVHRAAKTDRWELVGPLLDLFDSYDLNYIDPESGLTHYHIACMAGLASVERFIEHGQDPNGLVLTGTNDSPLHLALDYVYYTYNQAAEILLRRGADQNSVNAKGETPLHVICKCRDDVKTLEKMFEIAGDLNQQLQVNARDNMGNTPLHLALSNRRIKSAKLLLNRGADPTLANEDGETPLHVICKGDKDDVSIELFFRICDEKNLKVDVNAKDNADRTPLQWAMTNLKLDAIEYLWEREGIDTSSLAFPTERDLDELVASHARDSVKSKLELIPDVVGFVYFLEAAEDYDLVVSDVLKIMKFFIKLGVYMLSVKLREDLKNNEPMMEHFRRESSEKKFRENKSFYDLIQSGVHAASRIFTYSDFETTCKLFGYNHVHHRYVKLKTCEIMLRGFFLRYAVNYFEEMTGHRLPHECCHKIIDQDFTNNDLYKICLAAANESDRQNGEIDAMTDEINFCYLRFC